MKKQFLHFVIFIKLFCLCMSIVFLVRGMRSASVQSSSDDVKTFTINRESNELISQIQTVDNYLSSVTGEQIALAVYSSGETRLILPATADYEIYRAYLHSIQPVADADTVDHAPPLSSDTDISDIAHHTTQQEFTLMVTFMLLALFL